MASLETRLYSSVVIRSKTTALYIENYGIGYRVFSTGLKAFYSLSNNCHWAWIIDITLFDLFGSASHDFHLYNGLEHNIRKLILPNRLPVESRE